MARLGWDAVQCLAEHRGNVVIDSPTERRTCIDRQQCDRGVGERFVVGLLASLLDRSLQERPAGRAAAIQECCGEVDVEEKTEMGCVRWDQFQHGEGLF